MKKKLLLISLFLPLLLVAQNNLPKEQADSLWAVWSNPQQPDTIRLKAIHDYAWNGYLFTKPDSAFYYAQLLYDFAKSKGLKKQMADALNLQGISYSFKGDYANAIYYFTKSLNIKEEIGDKRGIASLLNNIGLIYSNQRDYKTALAYFTKSLKIREEIGDKPGIANSLNNIGLIYSNQGDYTQIDYFIKSLKIKQEIGDKLGIASSLNNIGSVYNNKGDYTKALEYYTKSLKIREEIGDKRGIANSLNNIGDIYIKKEKFSLAYDYCNKSLKIAKEINAIIEISSAAQALWKINKKLGQYKKALDMYELYIETRDSILSEENQKEVMHQEFQYEYEKKAAADSVANAKANEIKNAQIAQQQAEIKAKRNQQYGLYGGLILVIAFAGFMYNRFKITQKQKKIIEQQKEIVEKAHHNLEEKNKEITDSINYAKRIQEAILPSRYSLIENLKNGFVFFKPKDIVSGDFYWLEAPPPTEGGIWSSSIPTLGGQRGAIYFAAADCTGHGVPGAMVSVMCSNALSKALLEENITIPGKILDRTRELVVQRFSKSSEDVKDGMDISLCGLDLNNKKLSWSGANNPLWIINPNRKSWPDNSLPFGSVLGHKLGEGRGGAEYKPNKQSIGKVENPEPFTTHTIELQKGDTIYIFTDGFADQFGGKKGKKMMYKPFKELLLSIQDKTMDEQKEILAQHFEKWKGNLEQVDDVCVIGVRI